MSDRPPNALDTPMLAYRDPLLDPSPPTAVSLLQAVAAGVLGLLCIAGAVLTGVIAVAMWYDMAPAWKSVSWTGMCLALVLASWLSVVTVSHYVRRKPRERGEQG